MLLHEPTPCYLANCRSIRRKEFWYPSSDDHDTVTPLGGLYNNQINTLDFMYHVCVHTMAMTFV